jgi:hypothetical protein
MTESQLREPATIVLGALLAGLEVTDENTGSIYGMTEDYDIAEKRVSINNGEVIWIPLHAPVGWLVNLARGMSFDHLFLLAANTTLNKYKGDKRVTR